MIINQGDEIPPDLNAYDIQIERKDIVNELDFRHYLLQYDYLPFTHYSKNERKDKVYIVNIGEEKDKNLTKVMSQTTSSAHLTKKTPNYQDIALTNISFHYRDKYNLIPFLLDQSFRKAVEYRHGENVIFSYGSNNNRLFFKNKIVKEDSQFNVRYLYGIKYKIVFIEPKNFALLLDYSPYLMSNSGDGNIRNWYQGEEKINPRSKKRQNLNQELIDILFNEEKLIMRLGDLRFVLLPKYVTIEGNIAEVEI